MTETIEHYPLLGDFVVLGEVGIVQDGTKILQDPPLCHRFLLLAVTSPH